MSATGRGGRWACAGAALAVVVCAVAGAGELTVDVRGTAVPRVAVEGHPPLTEPEIAAYRDVLAFLLGVGDLFAIPADDRPPLNGVVTGTVVGDGYTIDRLHYESLPGYHVAANLYVPDPAAFPAPRPAVVMPHGHFDSGKADPTVQTPAIGLVLQGYVVLAYDVASGFDRSVRYYIETNDILANAQAYVGGPLASGIEAYEVSRAVDYLVEQADLVDPARIAAVGASGGASQAIYGTILDARIGVLVPVVYGGVGYVHKLGAPDESVPLLGRYMDRAVLLTLVYPAAVSYLTEADDDDAYLARITYEALGRPERHRYEVVPAPHDFSAPYRERMYAWLARWLRDESVGDTLPDPPGVFDGMPLWPTDALRVTIPAGDPSLLAETHGLRGGLPGLARPTTPEAWDAQADAIRASVADLAAWPGSTEPLAVTPGAPGDNPETIVIEPEDLAVDVTSDGVTHTWDSVLTATLRKPGTSAPWPCVILMNPVEIAAGDADYEALYTPISETSVVNALVAAGYAVLSLPQRFTGGPLPGAAYADQYAFESAVSRALNWYGTPVFGRHVHDVSVTLSVLAARADIVPERISVWGIGPAGPIALTAGMRDARLCQVAADRGLLSWDRESTDRHPVWSYPPKLLTAADAAHVASTIAPRRLVVTGSRDDLRVALSTSQTAARMDWATGAYAARGVPRQLRLIAGAGGIAGVTALSPSCGPASLGPIELYSLRADYVDRKVRVSWETTVEPDVQGYHVRRSEAQGGPYARVSTTMTAPVGDANHGGAYAFDDAGVATGKTYYYTIEAVPTMGASVEYGPVQIVIPRPGGCGVLAGDAAGGTLVLTLLAIALIARRRRR